MPDRLLFLDFETTGVDPYRDRVVEACFIMPGELCEVWRINPGVPIPAEASTVHGITDDDVSSCPPFSAFAKRIQAMAEGAVLCTHNGRRFDTPLLDAELRRAGQPGLPRHADGRLAVREIDTYALWMRCEQRTLASAARRFAGVDLIDAHSAGADTAVLPEVLDGMRQAFGLGEASIGDLCAMCVPEGEVDRDGKFKRREDGVVVFGFGKHDGQPVANHADYLGWMMKNDFSAETKAFARKFINAVAAGGRV